MNMLITDCANCVLMVHPSMLNGHDASKPLLHPEKSTRESSQLRLMFLVC